MALVIQLSVFTPDEAKLHKRPYTLEWNLAGATPEQFQAAAILLENLSAKMGQQAVARLQSERPGGDTDDHPSLRGH